MTSPNHCDAVSDNDSGNKINTADEEHVNMDLLGQGTRQPERSYALATIKKWCPIKTRIKLRASVACNCVSVVIIIILVLVLVYRNRDLLAEVERLKTKGNITEENRKSNQSEYTQKLPSRCHSPVYRSVDKIEYKDSFTGIFTKDNVSYTNCEDRNRTCSDFMDAGNLLCGGTSITCDKLAYMCNRDNYCPGGTPCACFKGNEKPVCPVLITCEQLENSEKGSLKNCQHVAFKDMNNPKCRLEIIGHSYVCDNTIKATTADNLPLCYS